MLLEAKVIKMKRNDKGETNALHVSEKILFTEYYLHTQMVTKMKIYNMNALFVFKIKIIVGDTFIIGIAQATAMRLAALPLPSSITVKLKKARIGTKYDNKAKEVEEMSECFSKIARISHRRRFKE